MFAIPNHIELIFILMRTHVTDGKKIHCRIVVSHRAIFFIHQAYVTYTDYCLSGNYCLKNFRIMILIKKENERRFILLLSYIRLSTENMKYSVYYIWKLIPRIS